MQNEYTVNKALFFKRFKEGRSDRARIGSLALYVLFAVYFAGWAVFGIIKNVTAVLVIIGFVISAFSLFIAFFGDKLAVSSRYKKASKYQKANKWTYSVNFGDNITVNDGKKSLTFEYSDIENILETSGDGILVFGNKYEVRVRKDRFVNGDWESCKAMFNIEK